MKNTILSQTFNKIQLIIVSLISVGIIIGGFFTTSSTHLFIYAYLLFCLCIIIIAYKLRSILYNNPKIRFAFVVIVAFILRMIASYFLNLSPKGDYANYLMIARRINDDSYEKMLYYGVFPHALHYPMFISLFYKLLGTLTWIPRGINQILGIVEVAIAYLLIEKTMNVRFGIIAGLAVALSPNIVIFSLLSGGEPIYAPLILGSLFLITIGNKCTKKPMLLYNLLGGMLCGISSFFRPTGIILILATLIYYILYDKHALKLKFLKICAIVLSFMITSSIMDIATASVSGYKKPSPSYGWNLYIGANFETEGQWNIEDSEHFITILKKYDHPSDIQKYFAHLGWQRYASMGGNIFKHFSNKIKVWLNEDYLAYVVTNWQNTYTRFQSQTLYDGYYFLVKMYNLFIMIGVLIGLFSATLSRKTLPISVRILCLYIIGSIMLFLMLETAPRYKGAYYSAMTVFAVYGYWSLQFLPFFKKNKTDDKYCQ